MNDGQAIEQQVESAIQACGGVKAVLAALADAVERRTVTAAALAETGRRLAELAEALGTAAERLGLDATAGS